MTHWRRFGLVVRPDSDLWWSRSHCMMPTPEPLSGSLWRLYFGGRNARNQSHIGWVVIDLETPDRVVESGAEPVLAPGDLGCFDDNGVLPSCVVSDGAETRLYYVGFKPGGTTRMDLFAGLAVRRPGETRFRRWSRAPILERTPVNPYINTAPWVVRAEGGWRMYYVGGTRWETPDLPHYNIQVATSSDGLTWKRDGRVAIDFEPGENALARPTVHHDGTRWVMWFASKGAAYRACVATSDDGLSWTRVPGGPGLEPSPDGPDSDMLEYFVVLNQGGRRIVYYNGNNYGEEGICGAIEE